MPSYSSAKEKDQWRPVFLLHCCVSDCSDHPVHDDIRGLARIQSSAEASAKHVRPYKRFSRTMEKHKQDG